LHHVKGFLSVKDEIDFCRPSVVGFSINLTWCKWFKFKSWKGVLQQW